MCNVHVWTVCMGHSVTSRGQESGSAFSVQNTDKEVYIEYLPLVAKGYKKLKVKDLQYSCFLIACLYLYPIQHTCISTLFLSIPYSISQLHDISMLLQLKVHVCVNWTLTGFYTH